MNTSDRIRAHVRTMAGEFTTSDVVSDMDDPLANVGLVSQVMGRMVEDGQLRRVARGIYASTSPATAPVFTPPAPAEAPVEAPAEAPAPAPAEDVAMATGFAWADIVVPERVSLRARQVSTLVDLVGQHLDELKNHPGQWAQLAVFSRQLSKGMVDDRAKALRGAHPGLATRVIERTLYVAWEE